MAVPNFPLFELERLDPPIVAVATDGSRHVLPGLKVEHPVSMLDHEGKFDLYGMKGYLQIFPST